MKLARLALGACALALLAGHAPQARAERVQFDPVYNHVVCDSGCTGGTGWNMAGLANIAVTNASARTALPTVSTNVWIINTGATAVQYALGDNTVVATTSSATLASGACALLAEGANTNIATISATSGNLQVQTGAGTPLSCGGGGGGGGGGAVTVADGANVTLGSKADAATCATTNTEMGCLRQIDADIKGTGTVQGTETAGAATTGGGVRIMGSDGTNARDISTDTSGHVNTNAAATMAVASAVDGWSVPEGATTASASCASGQGVNPCLKKMDADINLPVPAQSSHGVNIGGVEGLAAPNTTPTSYPLHDGCIYNTGLTALTTGQIAPQACNPWGEQVQAPYGGMQTALTAASGNVANASAAATLAAAVGKTTYITGFQCTAAGSTAALVVNMTVAGVITGTMTYTFAFPAGVTTLATPINVTFSKPVPASTTNTAIVVTLPAGGTGNTNAACNAQGFRE